MSIQTVLAAGFLFLGGMLTLLTDQIAGVSVEFLLLGWALLLLGGGLLIACLWFAFDKKFPKYIPDSTKEDSHENT